MFVCRLKCRRRRELERRREREREGERRWSENGCYMDREEFLKYQETGARQAVDSLSGHRLSDPELKRLQTAQHTSDQAVFQV